MAINDTVCAEPRGVAASVDASLGPTSFGDAPALSKLVQHLLLQEQQSAQRMASVLHDRLGQTLAAIRMNLDLIRPGPGGPSQDELPGEIDRIENLLDQAIRGVRQMLTELRPPLLAAHGLVKALDHDIQRRDAQDETVDVLLEVDDAVRDLRWPPDVEYGVFMIAREAIDNALRHADATLVRVLLGGGAGKLTLEVIDDGPGPVALGLGEDSAGLGITTMRERARTLAANFSMSVAADCGTRVVLHWEAVAP